MVDQERTEDAASDALSNPYRFLSLKDAGKVLGFSKAVMTEISKAGAPTVGGKVNLPTLIEWLKVNHSKVEKTRSENPVKENQMENLRPPYTLRAPLNG